MNKYRVYALYQKYTQFLNKKLKLLNVEWRVSLRDDQQ